MMECYVAQCEKAMQTGKRDDLPKILQTKLALQKSDREDKALANSNSPPKSAETVPTPTVTEASACTSATTTTVVISSVTGEKEKGQKQKKQKEKEPNVEEVVAIESDVESEAH